MSAALAATVMDRIVADTVTSLVSGDEVVEIPRQQLCAVAAAWAIYSREPSQRLSERAAAAEFCVLIGKRLREIAVDDDVVQRYRAYAATIETQFPERLLH
jgi:hypothetical protein